MTQVWIGWEYDPNSDPINLRGRNFNLLYICTTFKLKFESIMKEECKTTQSLQQI